jgi:hypothetical protein
MATATKTASPAKKTTAKAPPTKTAARKPAATKAAAAKKAPAKKTIAAVVSDTSNVRPIRGSHPQRVDSDAAHDAIMQAAEDAKNDSSRASIETGPRVANMRDVEKMAGNLSDNFLHCRDFGHNWKMADVRREGRGFTRRMYCPSCKLDKFQTLDSRGVVVDQKMRYPEGYLIQGMGRVNGDGKAVLRLASVVRAVEKTEGKQKAAAS